MSESYKKLVKTLQSIFEMDKADLDFGIYRIMNQKRDDINDFLENDLLSQVKESFEDYNSEGRGDLQQELETAIEQAKKFGALNPETTDPVIEIRQRIDSSVDAVAIENDVFSKLHTFFSRYYDKGDFISKRRYKADTYSIPYEGEEVKLYWANHDQYYIKSSEHLRDYAFTVEDDKKSVRIKLVKADAEKDNIKEKSGEERRFVLDKEYPLSEENGELLIHFNFLPIGKKKQEKLNEEAVKVVFEQTGFDDWLVLLSQLAPTDKKPKRTLLERHLNEYTARNTFDYFIHKDLAGFLNRELDFFIKNEVLFLDDIGEASFGVTEQQLRKIKVIRSIAKKIIRMLAQLENFQKKLWLKKKFVIETNYCITLDHLVDHTRILEKIFSNEDQINEWERLFSIDLEKFNNDYKEINLSKFILMDEYRYLIVDTKFFNQSLKDEITATFTNLDKELNGLLINSDNFQALNLSQAYYKEKVKCIYVDPPYNTSEETFIYKNLYRHSSWLTMIANRALLAKTFLDDDGVLLIAIDDEEVYHLKLLLDGIFPEGYIGTIVTQSNPRGRGTNSFYATSHDYYLAYAPNPDLVNIIDQTLSKEQRGAYSFSDEISEYRLLPFRRSGGLSTPSDRPNSEFSIYYSPSLDKIIGVGGKRIYDHHSKYETNTAFFLLNDSSEVKEYSLDILFETSPADIVEITPIDSTGGRRVWRWSDRGKIMQYAINGDFIVKNRGDSYSIQLKDRIKDGRKPKTVWVDSKYDASSHGTNLLQSFFGDRGSFGYPKSIHSTKDSLHSVIGKDNTSITVDFFGGSGTTAQAVIDLNREELNGMRKYVLVEMGKHFDEVLKPRVQKSVYSKEWKDGKPVNFKSGVSHCFKYSKLEAYEDTLNNLELRSDKIKKDLLTSSINLKEDYMLGYWLDIEAANSSSLLNIDQFSDPFNYKLNIGTGSVGVTKETIVDLVETFNYLIGLKVKTIDVLKGFKVVIGTNFQDESVLIVWRNTKEKDNNALEDFLDKQGYNPRDSEFDHIYVNGDHTLEDPRSIVKMIEIEFKRLMFDVEDV